MVENSDTVKKTDDISIELIDHVGWRLWRINRQWKDRFDAGMRACGYSWFGEARSNVIAHIGRKGIRQRVLVKRMGLTKQAVQQLVDELVGEGILQRRPDPEDKRGNVIEFTSAGLRMLADANAVKRSIEETYRQKLGGAAFDGLVRSLRLLDEGET